MKPILSTCIFLFALSSNLEAAHPQQKKQGHLILHDNVASYEEYCHLEINRVRAEHGLQPLKWWAKLSECARQHSQNMAEGITEFGHDGFEQRFKEMRKVARLDFFGENVAYCHNYPDPVQISVEGWMNSEGHRKNILNEFEETGIGVAISKEGRFYITQLFARKISSHK